MILPRWTRALLRLVVPPDRQEDVLGDLEEAHRRRVGHRSAVIAYLVTAFEAVDITFSLLRERRRSRRTAAETLTRSRDAGARDALFSRLDFTLAFRMLVRYPGLTVIGVLALTFAIATGAGVFEFLRQVIYPTLPLDDGARIVAVQNWDAAESRVESRVAYDFAVWREQLTSIVDLSGWRPLRRNLITGEGRSEPLTGAEVSATAFRVARVPAHVGRTLVEADELRDAIPVVVLGYEVWQTRFAGDPDVIGRVVRLGDVPTTVVGVMPEEFAFPVEHEMWTPLSLSTATGGPGSGPAFSVFGRLAPGVSFAEAQTELTALGLRVSREFPETHEHLRPEVMPYTQSIFSLSAAEAAGVMSINVFVLMLLALIASNIALLMFARAAARDSEIAVRYALGASRRRIVTQLFAEALVLSGIAAAIGLPVARFGLGWGLDVALSMGERLPFWIDDRLAPATMLYAAGLTLVGAIIAGVVPALKVTRGGMETRLRQAAVGERSLSFGGLWTGVIITQVAVTIALPSSAFFVRRDAAQLRAIEVGVPAEEYLSARLEMDGDLRAAGTDTSQAAFRTKFRATSEEFTRRLALDPAVTSVTFGTGLPRMYHPHGLIELDDDVTTDTTLSRASSASVDVDFFDVLDTPLLAGRGFRLSDIGSNAVVVNQSFVTDVLGGRNAVGRRLRHAFPDDRDANGAPLGEPEPWYEIVGVVPDMGMAAPSTERRAGFYHPASAADAYPPYLAIRVRGDPGSFEPQLRAVALAVDPALRLTRVQPLDAVQAGDLKFYGFWFRLTLMVSSVALLLSTAGIYAVMAFTVARRTREIGIRVALGSEGQRIALAIFKRPLIQIAFGALAGGTLVGALSRTILGPLTPMEITTIGVYTLCMSGVCLLACIVPTRRALGVQPTEALRET